MCVIAAKPQGIIIPEETLRRCFTSNPDGAGFVYANGGVLHSAKGFFTFEEFYAAYQPHESHAAVIHFRIKTHGEKNAEMCHPFQVSDRLFVAHNGIINIDTSADRTKSDTWHFNELVLKPELSRSNAALARPSFQFMLSCAIGGGSKLAFLDKDGKITIINEEKGEWDGTVWYSNTSFRAFRTTTRTYSGSGSSSAYGGNNYGGYSSTASGPGKTTSKAKTSYATLEAIPSRDRWIVDSLLAFGFDSVDVLSEFNADTAEDLALSLLANYTRRKKAGEEVTREEIATELALHSCGGC